MTAAHFTLESEHRAQLGDMLRDAGIAPGAAVLEAFSARVASSVSAYLEIAGQPRLTERRAELRALLALVEAVDPPIGQVRSRLRELSDAAIADLDDRASRLAPRLLDQAWPAGGVREWAAGAHADELLAFLRALIVQGGIATPGRKRADGTRRGSKVAPIILGSAAGLHAAGPAGTAPIYGNGRPAGDELVQLLAFLAVDWLITTGQAPVAGRSEGTAFGRLVHTALNWLERDDQAGGALRRYWALVQEGMPVPTADIEIPTPMISISQ